MAETKWSRLILFVCALADASFLPLPITAYFMILVIVDTRLIWKYILIVVSGTVVGSIFGYYLGHFLWIKPNGDFSSVAYFFNNHIHGFSLTIYDRIRDLFSKWNFWILCAATATPLPYGVFSVSSGIFNLNIVTFAITTLLSQTVKYSFLAVLISLFGSRYKYILKSEWSRAFIVAATFVLIAIILSRTLLKSL
jgi:membrane protein YqaA with SNARE-associated domain